MCLKRSHLGKLQGSKTVNCTYIGVHKCSQQELALSSSDNSSSSNQGGVDKGVGRTRMTVQKFEGYLLFLGLKGQGREESLKPRRKRSLWATAFEVQCPLWEKTVDLGDCKEGSEKPPSSLCSLLGGWTHQKPEGKGACCSSWRSIYLREVRVWRVGQECKQLIFKVLGIF